MDNIKTNHSKDIKKSVTFFCCCTTIIVKGWLYWKIKVQRMFGTDGVRDIANKGFMAPRQQ